MKFTIDGREYEDYLLSNEQIVRLLEGDYEVTDMGHDLLMKKTYERFKNHCCPRNGETNDDVFARFFSDYVNRIPNDSKRAAKAMGKDHRYLQNEMFKVCLEYIEVLSNNYANGTFDGRNEYACKASSKIVEHLKNIHLL